MTCVFLSSSRVTAIHPPVNASSVFKRTFQTVPVCHVTDHTQASATLGYTESNLSYSLHKPSRRNFEQNEVYASEIYSLWDTDLAFVQDVAKEDDGVNYLLVVIDVFSKYVWVRPMENETVHSLLEAFDFVLSEGTKPEKLRTDKGAEFLNESFRQYLKKKDIQFCTANKEPKASVVE